MVHGHVWMWELDYKENWAPKHWCFWTVVLEKTLESPLDCKEIQPVHPKGDQAWVFTGRTDVEAETPVFWPRMWTILEKVLRVHQKNVYFAGVLIGVCYCSVAQSWLFATPWIAARQASLSITISRSSLRLTSIESMMPSSHLILGHPLLLLPPIPPSIRIFSNESTLRIRWPKYWHFSFSISPSNGLISLQSKGLSRVFSNTTVQKHQFFG